jgi:hypothetical protein
MQMAAFRADPVGKNQFLAIGTANEVHFFQVFMGSSLLGYGTRSLSFWYSHDISVDKWFFGIMLNRQIGSMPEIFSVPSRQELKKGYSRNFQGTGNFRYCD